MQYGGRASGEPIFANGAVTGAFSQAFNHERSEQERAELKETIFKSFDSEFVKEFQKRNPVEFSMFVEHAKSYGIDILTDDFRYYEVAWRRFESYAQTASLEILKAEGQSLSESFYGPQNALGGAPGLAGKAIGFYNDIGTVQGMGDSMRVTNEALNIRINGPQVINRGLFNKMFGTDYNPKLNELIK